MNDKIVMPVWAVGLFIVVMNTTMFNVSIPSIIADLRISSDMASWIISSYSIGYALSTVIYSRLSDSVTLRKLLTVGLVLLGLSSVLGIFAHEFRTLLAARMLQSTGAGAMSGLGLVLASRYIPSERRGRAIAMISAGSAMAFGLGPIIGGLISEYFGWNGLFVITCLVLAILPVLLRLLPREGPIKATRFDIGGAILTVVNAASLLIALTQQSWLWLAVGVLSLAIHAVYLRKSKETFINPELLKKAGYRKLLVIGFCILVVNLGNLFLMPLVLAHLFEKSPLSIGLFIAPGAILSAIMTRFFGRWIDRYGNMPILLIGHAGLALVMAFFALDVAGSPVIILCGYLVFSPALSATLASLNNETSLQLPRNLIGAGMGLMQLLQFFGGSVSVAACGLLLEYQSEIPMYEAFQRVYAALLIVCLGSAVMLIAYRKKAREAAV
jgi:DHA2 family metal-tetracycline-proton antiporter-like MFS transporter